MQQKINAVDSVYLYNQNKKKYIYNLKRKIQVF